MPASLLQTWHDQMTEHLEPGTLCWHIYRGSGRRNIWKALSSVQVVLTTYDVVASEYRKALGSDAAFSSTPIFSRTWTRVVLDEAHLIRNTAALRTKASFCKLHHSTTPQYLMSISSNPGRRDQIPERWKKLRKLVKAVAIRRSKKLLGLPAREDQVNRVEFSEDERKRNEKIRLRIRDVAFDSDGTNFCTHIPRWIDDLRGLCGHGGEPMRASRSSMHLPSTNKARSPLQTSAAVDFDQMSFLLSDDLLATTNQERDFCETANISDMLTDGVDDRQELSPNWRSSCKRPYQWPPNCFLSTPDASGCNSPSLASPAESDHAPVYSSKVSALLSDIFKHGGKAVVFSFWRTTLDMVSRSFEDCGLRFVRVDGTMPNRERDSTLNVFRSDISIKVLWATVSAAGLGLDITVAKLSLSAGASMESIDRGAGAEPSASNEADEACKDHQIRRQEYHRGEHY
ncbi:uncharacterized protein A1O5_08696 [Cladophialophora psammophila CBS 110553]|uniref:Helicase ATP-binding domain-containing protein n=1 Tax=Cladophialophora psammophila CBS 110553 TaxID=1182543 RepID=W9WTU7_9EURO|nr:uncharacterized protein A1O5_08696 [Cladophialophora psammophila CBS 110553]EXJ68081.1 hypothetical protein A1O5_08696 [Cladophialophora psammophila CBS 110553]